MFDDNDAWNAIFSETFLIVCVLFYNASFMINVVFCYNPKVTIRHNIFNYLSHLLETIVQCRVSIIGKKLVI